MKTSIVPEILNSEEVEIRDEMNILVTLGQPSQFRFNYSSFRKPYLVIDNFEKGKFKSFEIKRITLEELDKMGFRLVALNATSKTRNYPRQGKIYMLENKNYPEPKSDILYKIPKDHYIEFDFENKRIRIKGKNAFPYLRPENASRWKELS